MVNHRDSLPFGENMWMFPTTLKKGRLQLRKQKWMRTKQQRIWKILDARWKQSVWSKHKTHFLKHNPNDAKAWQTASKNEKGLAAAKWLMQKDGKKYAAKIAASQALKKLTKWTNSIAVRESHPSSKLTWRWTILMRPRPNSSNSVTMSRWELPTLGPRMDEGPCPFCGVWGLYKNVVASLWCLVGGFIPLKLIIAPETCWLGDHLAFWEDLFSGAMLVLREGTIGINRLFFWVRFWKTSCEIKVWGGENVQVFWLAAFQKITPIRLKISANLRMKPFLCPINLWSMWKSVNGSSIQLWVFFGEQT